MNRVLLYGLFLSTLAVISTACDDAENPASGDENTRAPLVVKNGTLIDGTGSDPVPGAVIVIEGQIISSVGVDSTVDVPPGAVFVDARGGYILPGFMNTHVHGAYSARNLREWARDGVTTVRDLGTFSFTPARAYSVRDALLLDSGNARLIAAGPIVTAVGGYGNYYVASPSDAESKINGLINAGADVIKIAIEDDLQGRTWPMLTPEEVTVIVNTAHSRGIKVSAHVSRSEHAEIAVRSGVDDVNHMIVNELPDSLISRMVAADVYWVPTLELWDGVSDLHAMDWDIVAKANLARFVRAGGKVAIGTDYDGYVTPFELGMPLTEMRLMSEAGMTPMEIITAGTKNAAFVCDRENELGTITPGKIADVIIVSGNPLADLLALGSVRTVIHNGEVIKNEG